MRRLPLYTLLLLSLALPSQAADQGYQDGTLLDITTRQDEIVSTAQCQATTERRDNPKSLMPCVAEEAGMVRHYARIQVGNVVYIGTWHKHWDWSSHGDWTVNTPVRVRLDKNDMHVRWTMRDTESRMDVRATMEASGTERAAVR